jgi:hypothetical protein
VSPGERIDVTPSSTPLAPLRSAAPALVLSALVLAPFLGKAFTMDDTVFLFEAEHALGDPLHPTAFEMAWTDVPQRISTIVPTGPVMAWLLVPAVLAGGAEWVAHLMQLAMLWVAILATVSLALRLGLAPRVAAASGLLLAATPAVLGMAGTAMPDVPAMAIGVAGLERLVAWRDERRAHQGAAAAVLLALAPLTRTHLVLLLPLGALWMVGDVLSFAAWRRGPWTRWIPLALAALLAVGLGLLTRDPAGGGGTLAAAAAGLSHSRFIGPNLAAFGAHWVLAMAFALPWAVVRWRSILGRWWLLLAATAGAAAVLRLGHVRDASYALAPVAGLGLAVLADVLADAVRRRDGVQAVLGLWLLLAAPTAIYVHLPSKYLLASAPAAAILLSRAIAERPRVGRPVLAVTLALGVALGVAILRADAAFAGLGRQAARTLIAPSVAAGHRVWYAGHWGFQWYAEKAGARFFPVTPPYPEVGDLVVSSANSEPHIIPEEMHALVRLGRLEDRSPGGRVMDKRSGTGFFSNSWGYLPWSWSEDAIDTYDLWRVVPQP